jgi:(+)-pinoresinol hydroxylase
MRRAHPCSALAFLPALLLPHVVRAQAGAAPEPTGNLPGHAVYEHWCAPCHARGPGHPGTQSLQLKYAGAKPAVLLERTDLAPEAVKVFVRQGVLLMAPFRKTEITDFELDALARYVTRNLKAP